MNPTGARPDAERGRKTSDPHGAILPLFIGFSASLTIWAIAVTILIMVG